MIAGLALGFLVVFSMTSVWGWEFLPHWVARHLAFVEHLATHLYWRWPMWTLLASAILLTVAYCLVLGVGRTFYMIQVPIYFWIPPWAASLSINWFLGDGLPHWMARYLAALGVPASPPEGWPGWTGFVVVVGAVLASMALTLIGVIAGALVIFWVRKTFLGYVPPSLTDDP